MRQCPQCQTVYADDALLFCLNDGAKLQFARDPDETLPAYDPNATLPYPPASATQPTLVETQPAPPARVVAPIVTTPQTPVQPQVIKQGVSPVIVGALVGLLILALGGLALFALKDSLFQPSPIAQATPTPAPPATPQREIVIVKEPAAPASNRPLPAPTAPPTVANKTPGRFPEASERNLSGEDLAENKCPELKIMRNEIFARHGFIFQTPDMADYFSRQSWYRGTTRDVTKQLTGIERANLIIIKSYEEGLGCR